MKDNYTTPKQLRFVTLQDKHTTQIENFQTYQKDLKEYLVEDALMAKELQVGRTLLIFDKAEVNIKKRTENCAVLGYVTILTDSINLNADLKQQFRAKGINYKSLPAVKIGRFCIDDRYRGRGMGKCALYEIIRKTIIFNDACACRYITLDAKRHKDSDKDSFQFYKKHGFKVLKSRTDPRFQTSGATSMFLDLYHLRKALEQNK